MTERIDLKVGFACNNLCRFCVQGDKRQTLAAKPLAQLLRALAEGRRSGADGVVFTGGEPSLHPGLLAAVRHARRLGYRNVQIQTNGRTFCYTRLVKDLIAAGVNEFGPSLHGSRPEIHDFLTGAPGSFLQTVAGMRNIKKLGARLITNTVITKANYRDLPELARLLVALGADQFQFAFMHLTGRAGQNKGWLTARKSIIVPWVKKGLDVGLRAGRRVMTEAIPYCFMSGYENQVAERIIPTTKIFDAETVIEDYTRTRRDQGKAKGPRCPRCAYFPLCEGPWREYPEMFGWDEFIPIERKRGRDRTAEPDADSLGATKIMDLALARNCQNRCVFCGNFRQKVPLWGTQKILRKLEAGRRAGYDGVEFSAKEFTLREDAPAIFRHARDLGFSLVHLLTNGQELADPQKARSILESGVNKLTLSLHSDRPETETAITGNPESFPRKMAAIANIMAHLADRRRPLLFAVNTVMTPLTTARLDRIIGFVAAQGIRHHNVFFPQISPHMLAAFDETVPWFSKLAAPLRRGIRQAARAGARCTIVDVPLCILPEQTEACGGRLRKTIVRPRREGLYDVRRHKVKGPPCRECPFREDCEGVFADYIARRGWAEFRPPSPPKRRKSKS